MPDTIQKIVNNYSVTTNTVVANPSPAGTTPLTGLQVGDTKYTVSGGGTTVIANPSNPGTNPLNSIQIGTDKYIIQGGGGGTAEVKAGDSTYISLLQLKNYVASLYREYVEDGSGYNRYYHIALNGIQGTFFSTYNPTDSLVPANLTLTLNDIVSCFPEGADSYSFTLGALVINNSTPIVAPFYVTVKKLNDGARYPLSFYFNDTLVAEDFYTITDPEDLPSNLTIATALESLHAMDVSDDYQLSLVMIRWLNTLLLSQPLYSMTTLQTATLQCCILVGYQKSSGSILDPSTWSSLTGDSNLNLCTFNQFFTKFCGFGAMDTFIYGSKEAGC